jgi:hypothetical protein
VLAERRDDLVHVIGAVLDRQRGPVPIGGGDRQRDTLVAMLDPEGVRVEQHGELVVVEEVVRVAPVGDERRAIAAAVHEPELLPELLAIGRRVLDRLRELDLEALRRALDVRAARALRHRGDVRDGLQRLDERGLVAGGGDGRGRIRRQLARQRIGVIAACRGRKEQQRPTLGHDPTLSRPRRNRAARFVKRHHTTEVSQLRTRRMKPALSAAGPT